MFLVTSTFYTEPVHGGFSLWPCSSEGLTEDILPGALLLWKDNEWCYPSEDLARNVFWELCPSEKLMDNVFAGLTANKDFPGALPSKRQMENVYPNPWRNLCLIWKRS